MAYSRNPTWVDGVAGDTRIDAVDLNNIEDGLVAAANTADSAATAAAAAASTANSAAQKSANLSDLTSATTARTNLGLGTAAVTNTGTGSGNTILGNDSRLTDARTPTAHAASHATGQSDAVSPAAIGAVPTSRTVTAGTGLSGGGDLSANRTLSVAADAGLPSQTGNSGKFLTTNGTASSWGTPAGGGGSAVAPHVPKVSSYMGGALVYGHGTSAGAFASGADAPLRVVVGSQITVDQIGFRVQTAQAVNARALLYSSDSDGHPATLVANSGALSCSATGDIMGTITPVVLTPGVYWGFIRSNSGTTLRFQSCNQISAVQVADTFAHVWQQGSRLLADCGSYASPNATISAWSYSSNGDATTYPTIYLRRSA